MLSEDLNTDDCTNTDPDLSGVAVWLNDFKGKYEILQ